MYAETKKRLDEEIQLRLVSTGFLVFLLLLIHCLLLLHCLGGGGCDFGPCFLMQYLVFFLVFQSPP